MYLYKAVNIECKDSMVIMSHEVYQAVNKLSDNKASGLDNFAEHLK